MDLQTDAERDGVRYRAELGRYALAVYALAVTSGLMRSERDALARRIWRRDLSLWPGAEDPKQLGWLRRNGWQDG